MTSSSARRHLSHNPLAEVFDISNTSTYIDWMGADACVQSITGALITEQTTPALDAASKAIFALYEQQVTAQIRETERDIRTLHGLYVIERPSVVSDFLKNYRYVLSLLFEAERHLTEAFGQNLLISLKPVEDEQGIDSVRLAVNWPGEYADAAERMGAFDAAFWLANAKRSSGRLIIDYDLV